MTIQPLAFRMRPTHIDEIVGQKHILGPKTALYTMLKSGKVPSMLLYGEPGIGKTSIANAIAGTTDTPFALINATTSGKKDIEDVVKRAQKEGAMILAVDEVHRFNKIQQDALLPHVESGLITLIAMTTENPFHSVLPAVRSRCSLIKELERLTIEEIVFILKRAMDDKTKGLGELTIVISDELLALIGVSTNGEVRSSLNALEMSVYATPEIDGVRTIEEETVKEFLQNKGFNHDKDGDSHYNVLSAFQKSIRGSDTDAALHYLARLIEAGDETSIVRRLKVIAFEDIGITAQHTVNFVCHACDSVKELGFPEARIPLANAVVALCLSPKSNSSYKALDAAIADVQAGRLGEIPKHLKDSHYASASKLGNGVGYKYPHDYPLGTFGGWVQQEYLPVLLKSRQYYQPIEAGEEKTYRGIYNKLSDFKTKKN